MSANQGGEKEQREDIIFTFEYDKSRIPSYGLATTPLTITASGDATVSPRTSYIFANFTFPSEEFFINPIGSPEGTKIDSENIIIPYSLAITVKEPVTALDQVSEFWAKVGDLINFVYLIGGGQQHGYSPRISRRKRAKMKVTLQ